jgi:hypothetical protein
MESSSHIDCGIKLHHIMASSDDFSKLSMQWDLMPAAKLNYMHDYKGLYNCVSQVIYFHNPEYERRPQERKRIEQVSKGSDGIEMVQLIPSIMQMHPDIVVENEETNIFMPSNKKCKNKWCWLFMGQTIYLCHLVDRQNRQIFHHSNVAVLLHHYKTAIASMDE